MHSTRRLAFSGRWASCGSPTQARMQSEACTLHLVAQGLLPCAKENVAATAMKSTRRMPFERYTRRPARGSASANTFTPRVSSDASNRAKTKRSAPGSTPEKV